MWVVKEILLYSQRQIQLKLSLYKLVKEMFIKKNEQKCCVFNYMELLSKGPGGGRGRLTPFGLKLGKYLNPLGLT